MSTASTSSARLPGTDPALQSEVVMLGGHLDSWHSGTGATDNGAGVAVALEAMRILKAIGVQPRRTIRVALWTGEEQDYFGSVGYVERHFGTLKTVALKPEHAKLSATSISTTAAAASAASTCRATRRCGRSSRRGCVRSTISAPRR